MDMDCLELRTNLRHLDLMTTVRPVHSGLFTDPEPSFPHLSQQRVVAQQPPFPLYFMDLLAPTVNPPHLCVPDSIALFRLLLNVRLVVAEPLQAVVQDIPSFAVPPAMPFCIPLQGLPLARIVSSSTASSTRTVRSPIMAIESSNPLPCSSPAPHSPCPNAAPPFPRTNHRPQSAR